MKAAICSVLLLFIAVAVFFVAPGYSYLPSLTSTSAGPQPDRWDFSAFPVTWNINPQTGSNISGSRSVSDVIAAAFATWQAAPNVVLPVQQGGNSSVSSEASSPSNINLICFVCSDADFTKDSQTLAVTITTTADSAGSSDGHGGTSQFAGQIIKADIIFNPSTTFTTGGGSGQDLQTVATHEVGHFFGLSHSAVVRAVMFPSASNLTALSWDDLAGIATLYPKSSPDVATGAISGTVTKGGAGIFGAHVYAEPTSGGQPYGGSIRLTPVGTLTRPDGTYTIQGLPPGSYTVTAEPLDGPVSGSDVSGYPSAFGQPSLNTSFTTRSH
jgi:hypothetical protein